MELLNLDEEVDQYYLSAIGMEDDNQDEDPLFPEEEDEEYDFVESDDEDDDVKEDEDEEEVIDD